MNACKFTLAITIILCALALESASAFAEKVYVSGISFGELGAGPGQFSEPDGVAVNDSTNPLLEPLAGDVYVVDKGNNRIERFSATGVYLGQFNGSGVFEVEGKEVRHGTAAPTGELSHPEQAAIDNSGKPVVEDPSVGDVYVADEGHHVIDKFSAAGEYIGQITQAVCPPPNENSSPEQKKLEEEECPAKSDVPFTKIEAVAVGPYGDLWVSFETAKGRPYEFLDEFTNGGIFDRGYRDPSGENAHGLGIDSKGNLYLTAPSAVEKQDGTTFQQDWFEFFPGEAISSVAINPTTNNLLIDDQSGVLVYGPFGEPYGLVEGLVHLTPVDELEGISESYGLAVNETGTVYVSERGLGKVKSFDYVPVPTVTTQAPSAVTETGLVLHGSVNPEGEQVTECHFQYGTRTDSYTGEVPCSLNPGSGSDPVPVEAVVSGLPVADARSFRLVAKNANGLGYGKGLTVARPVTTGDAISGVASVVATASARVDPGSLASCYVIEYGTSLEYGKLMPETGCIAVGAGEGSVGLHMELSGLQPDTAYHFRIVSSNGLGTTIGKDVAFKTFPLGASEPPDGRVYELVSPVGAGHGEEVYVPAGLEHTLDYFGRHGIDTSRPFQAAPDGDTVTYLGDAPTKGGNGQIGDSSGNQFVARREDGGGWTQAVVAPSGAKNEYLALSDDLSTGLLLATGGEQPAASAPTGYPNLYSRTISWYMKTAGVFEPLLGEFEALITTKPTCTPTEFGAILDGYLAHYPLFGGENAGTDVIPADSHLLFETDAVLPSTPSASINPGCEAGNDLYDSFGGQLYLVNVLPSGETEADATFGRQGPSENGFVTPEVSHAISADGSLIYWSAVKPVKVGGGSEYEERPQELYVRENDTQPPSPVEGGECAIPADACTIEVDMAEPGMGPSGGGQFWTATSSGAKVFFTDENPLTKDSTAEPDKSGAPGELDLYEYNIEAPEGERLSDLSVGVKVGVHADVQGVVGTGEDGSYVYFVADGVLTEGKNAEDKEPVDGQPNLYVRHEGVTRFIATLANEDDDFTDGSEGDDGDWQADPGRRTAEVTPDGNSIVFMSRMSLTGYDNVLERTPLAEVFVYDAGTERLVCASCNPSGEAPVVPTPPEFMKDISGIWGAFLPVSESAADHQPRVISEDGNRVFFDSIEPLVPQDSNGLLDVYEWEAQGEGSCREAGGCVFLLSGGQSIDNAYLIDASASGDDVFFVTRADLVSADRGDYDELYDARVGGIVEPTEAACTGTGCQGVPPAPPIFATPSSLTFTGVGNFAPSVKEIAKCAKGSKLRQGTCRRIKVKHERARRANKRRQIRVSRRRRRR